jgi:hypothetical protein
VGDSRRLVFVDSEYDIEGFWSEDRRPFEGYLAISRDGRWLAVGMVNAEGLYDIWVSDFDRPRLALLVHEPAKDCLPHLWSPDGGLLVYRCASASSFGLYLRPDEGRGKPELLIETQVTGESYEANAFLHDQSRLIVTHETEGKSELLLLPIDPEEDGEVTPIPLVTDASGAQISPDGRWITYQSDSSGRSEVYLRRIHGDGSLGPEIPVSTDGGTYPVWYGGYVALPLGIRYFSQRDAFDVVVTTEPDVRISEPRLIANISELFPKIRGAYPLPDRRWLLILEGEDEAEPTEINVVLNWFSELNNRLNAAN